MGFVSFSHMGDGYFVFTLRGELSSGKGSVNKQHAGIESERLAELTQVFEWANFWRGGCSHVVRIAQADPIRALQGLPCLGGSLVGEIGREPPLASCRTGPGNSTPLKTISPFPPPPTKCALLGECWRHL